MSLDTIVTERATIVCSGSGGVGKTTTAAVLAMYAARAGRRSVVVTIDPARRLAQTLGIEEVGDEPHQIDPHLWDPDGERAQGGEMWAVMLDAKSTFDSLVRRHSANDEQADAILDNSFYRNISAALSGTQEYMAMEKLYELHESGDFDLVIVDTPPSRNALDFLEAPNRMTKFLEGRVFRMLSAPARGGMKIVTRATRSFLKTIARVLGSEVLDDVVEFFGVFEGMWEGFHDRADQVRKLLGSDATAFILIASPKRDTLAEAEFFAEALNQMGYPVAGAVVNRMHPRFSDALAQATRMRADTFAQESAGKGGDTEARTTLTELYANLASFQEIAQRERDHLQRLTDLVAPGPVSRVPFLGEDVHDFSSLRSLEKNLFDESVQ